MNKKENEESLLAWGFFPSASLADINELQKKLLRQKKGGNDILQYMLCAEHRPSISYQKDSDLGHIRIDPTEFWRLIKQSGIDIRRREYSTGGGITYHGPGQLTVYFVASNKEIGMPYPRDFKKSILGVFKEFFARYCDISAYTVPELWNKRDLLSFVGHELETLNIYTEKDMRKSPASGLWIIDEKQGKIKKIVSHGGRWKTKEKNIITDSIVLSGFGINISPDLYYSNEIIKPCGLDLEMTSVYNETGRTLAVYETAKTLAYLVAEALTLGIMEYEIKEYIDDWACSR